jgi:hypothetical protein
LLANQPISFFSFFQHRFYVRHIEIMIINVHTLTDVLSSANHSWRKLNLSFPHVYGCVGLSTHYCFKQSLCKLSS